jgi:hypothetical protein
VVAGGAVDVTGSEVNEGSTDWCLRHANQLALINANSSANLTSQARYCQFESFYR